MTDVKYKISCSLFGHTADVRTLDSTLDGKIISGSRDNSARLWEKNSSSIAGYTHIAAYTCHSNFVSSVCYLPPSAEYAQGVVVTGSNDKNIRLFEPMATTPFRVLSGHANTVCKVARGINGMTLLSASWDRTARCWKNVGNSWTHVEYSGHSAAVWSICQLASGIVVTASADKTLRVFQEAGAFLRELKGHTDCARDVVAADDEEVLSVANDATVRRWNVISGECLNTFYGHEHYIYSISIMPGVGWVTSSEDRTVKVWNLNGQIDSIAMPAASVWAVTVLPNLDIVAGTNDGVIRVLTRDSTRMADQQAQASFAAEVTDFTAKASQGVGGVKLSDLPGKEALYEPGRTDGQTKMIRDGNKAVAYAWSMGEGTWQLIGDVVGAPGADGNETGRPVYNGKEYDYVFNVDIEDGKPALKLPYNKTEDPWIAAQKFIHDNNLPQSYLEQVANFIVSNSDPTPMQVQADFVDPFTGSTRYVPQQGQEVSRQPVNRKPSAVVSASYFPQREFLRFDQANMVAIKEKLIALNNEHDYGINEAELSELIDKCSGDAVFSVQDLRLLDNLLTWPAESLLPVLDVTRLLIRFETINRHLCTDELLEKLQPLLKKSPNNMLVLRIMANMMVCEAGEALASKQRLKLIEFLFDVPLPYSKFIQVALTTLALNLSVLLRRSETGDGREELILSIQELLPSLSEPEAIFRALVALGTLLTNYADCSVKVDLFRSFLQHQRENGEGKIRECASDILAFVN